MKKRILSILFAGAMLLGTVGMAQAVPMYYTFEGIINSVNDNAGIIVDAGLAFGSSVSYVYLVDFDADGTHTRNDGNVYTVVDNAYNDFFYTDYISGSALQEKNGGYYNSGGNTAEYNYGFDGYADSGYIYGNSQNNLLFIYSSSVTVTDWAVGTAVTGRNWAYDSTGTSSYLNAALTLTDISATASGGAPVPEPATMLLLGSGLVGMFGFRKKKETV